MTEDSSRTQPDPLWYKDAVIYELHVKTFQDSSGDGMGDFRGLIEKIDYADLYVWSDTPERYKDARIIFKDFETSNWAWDPVAKAYYWHRFYSHQPDLNFDNPAVHELVQKVLDFWLNMGVDGLRLDAIPYLYEREGTICENLRETHEYLVKLRAHVDRKFPGRMLLAEIGRAHV